VEQAVGPAVGAGRDAVAAPTGCGTAAAAPQVPEVWDAAIAAVAPALVVAYPPTAVQSPASEHERDCSPGQSVLLAAAPAGSAIGVGGLQTPAVSVVAAGGCATSAG